MIKVNEISIVNGELTINVYIDNQTPDLYLKQITITRENDSTPFYTEELESLETKEWNHSYTASDFNISAGNLNDNIYIIHITTYGDADVPCGQGTLDYAIFNKCIGVKRILTHLKELNNICDIPKSLINEILMLRCAELAGKIGCTGDAIKYYNKFYKQLEHTAPSSCNCNG